jgi:hypothetical protein
MDHSSFIHWFWLLPLGLSALYLGSPRFLGKQASNRLSKLLQASLEPRRYTQVHDLELSVGGRVEHYDHLVFSRSGIHVIDALYLPGVIKGSRTQAWWQRTSWGRKFRFDNPVHENHLRLQALQQVLELPPASFLPCVAISGQSSLDTDAKDVVTDVSSVPGKILSQSRHLLSAEQLDDAILHIQQIRVHPPLLGKPQRWRLLQVFLWLLFLGGVYGVYRDDIHHVAGSVSLAVQSEDVLKTEQERWEDHLICSYSADTGRCACYETSGEKAEIAADRCKALAERGSVLQQ